MANLWDKKFLIDFKKNGCYSDACGESICNVKEPQFNYLADKLFGKKPTFMQIKAWNSEIVAFSVDVIEMLGSYPSCVSIRHS